MKTIKDTLLDRRSVRRYERIGITKEQLDFIYEAIRNTPTSYNGQQYSVIDVDDQELKERLYGIIGQKQVKTCNHFLVFCADYNKIVKGAEAKGLDMPEFYDTMDGVVVGVVDAALAMMSAIVAAESLGLGTCPIGYARTVAPDRIAEALGLPSHVMVVCGLAIGVPRETNDLKPKQPQPLLIHNNSYKQDDISRDLMAYDADIQRYNATRSGSTTSNDWIGHIIGYYREAMDYGMSAAFSRRGFDVKS